MEVGGGWWRLSGVVGSGVMVRFIPNLHLNLNHSLHYTFYLKPYGVLLRSGATAGVRLILADFGVGVPMRAWMERGQRAQPVDVLDQQAVLRRSVCVGDKAGGVKVGVDAIVP